MRDPDAVTLSLALLGRERSRVRDPVEASAVSRRDSSRMRARIRD